MTDDTAHNQIKPYCDINEALEWIAFGWPAFENRADRIPFERKQRFDGKTFRFAEAMNLPLPERKDNRRMMTDKEKISAVHPHWNEITFSSSGCFVQGLIRIEIPTDQLQILFPLALTQTENKSFSETLNELDYVSPYMLVMKDVIEELKISKTNQPVKKIVEHAVIESGNKRNIEISQRFAEYIAQAIRLPETQKGGAPKLSETKK